MNTKIDLRDRLSVEMAPGGAAVRLILFEVDEECAEAGKVFCSVKDIVEYAYEQADIGRIARSMARYTNDRCYDEPVLQLPKGLTIAKRITSLTTKLHKLIEHQVAAINPAAP